MLEGLLLQQQPQELAQQQERLQREQQAQDMALQQALKEQLGVRQLEE
jgi:hypothetical protein